MLTILYIYIPDTVRQIQKTFALALNAKTNTRKALFQAIPFGGGVFVSKCMGTDTALRYGGLAHTLRDLMLLVRAIANLARFNFFRKCSLSLSLLVISERTMEIISKNHMI